MNQPPYQHWPNNEGVTMLQGYLALKISWELFQKAPETLSEPEAKRVESIAGKQNSIEQAILASAEASTVVVPQATIQTRLKEIHQRYSNEDEFCQDMQRIGLDSKALEDAVQRDLRVEAILDKISSTAEPVSSIDAEIYYRMHPEAFDRPESRRLRHILMTFENPKEKIKITEQLLAMRSTLPTPEAFGEAALRHSHCPTALEGGMLGIVKRNQLYPELEPTAFSLRTNQISRVLESPMGLHIIRCDEVFPCGMLPFAEVEEKIISRLGDKRRREAQVNWIKQITRSQKD
jgi:peptidyl-prolyl cis-trans isomerase C